MTVNEVKQRLKLSLFQCHVPLKALSRNMYKAVAWPGFKSHAIAEWNSISLEKITKQLLRVNKDSIPRIGKLIIHKLLIPLWNLIEWWRN